jgi:hypothetical protein
VEEAGEEQVKLHVQENLDRGGGLGDLQQAFLPAIRVQGATGVAPQTHMNIAGPWLQETLARPVPTREEMLQSPLVPGVEGERFDPNELDLGGFDSPTIDLMGTSPVAP